MFSIHVRGLSSGGLKSWAGPGFMILGFKLRALRGWLAVLQGFKTSRVAGRDLRLEF